MLSTILGPTIPAQMANVVAMAASPAPSTWAISLELVLLQAQMKNFRMIRCEVIFSCVLHHDASAQIAIGDDEEIQQNVVHCSWSQRSRSKIQPSQAGCLALGSVPHFLKVR